MSACSNESPDKVTFERGAEPDEIFSDFVTQETDSGRVTWKLTAPKANRYSKKKLIVMEEPVIEFFDKLGRSKSQLVSRSGEYNEETRDMLAYGDVVVRTVDGDVLETDSLLYVNARDRIVSHSFVKLTRGKDIITGIGLECDPNLSFVDVKRDVKATIRDTEGEVGP